MRLLLSAYCCDPNGGSEHAVGWNWAMETVRLGHEVWVLTCTRLRPSIEAKLKELNYPPNLHFLYYQTPSWFENTRILPGRTYIHYFLWQWGAYQLARQAHRREKFQRVHHVTYVSARQPSFLGNLGIPFTFGPVAGGDRAPWRLRKNFGWRGWLWDAFRDVTNFLFKADPFVRRTFKQAEKIYVTSEQTLNLIPKKYRKKASVQLAIGFNPGEMSDLPGQPAPSPAKKDGFRILYVGRLLALKGMQLGIPAFGRLLKNRADARLTIVGSGPDKRRWRTMAEKFGIDQRIDWIPWLDRRELPSLYASHDVFLFPSLRDSGGMVVLEAMAYGLPVVCLDLGGPGEMVDPTCGIKVNTDGLNTDRTIQALAESLIQLSENPMLRRRLSKGACKRVKTFQWSELVSRLYTERKDINKEIGIGRRHWERSMVKLK